MQCRRKFDAVRTPVEPSDDKQSEESTNVNSQQPNKGLDESKKNNQNEKK